MARPDDLIINEMSNDEVVATFPKNADGQVEIDENGWVKGLPPEAQPVSQPGAPAAPALETEDPAEEASESASQETTEDLAK